MASTERARHAAWHGGGCRGIFHQPPAVAQGVCFFFHERIGRQSTGAFADAFLILGVDALLDMARTSVNVLGNCLASAVVARWEGEFDDAKAESFGKSGDGQS